MTGAGIGGRPGELTIEPAGGAAPGRDEAGTVLIADDQSLQRLIVGRLVAQAGLRPIYATNGAEALEVVAREDPIAVLTDMQMPVMDGLRLVSEIRERHPHIPVVLMTAHGSEGLAVRALKAGAATYVPKTMLPRELPDALRRVVEMAEADRKRRELLGSLDRREAAFRLGNEQRLFAPLVDLLQADLAAVGPWDPSSRMQVGMALHEALANALYHGNLEVCSSLRQTDDERPFYDLAEQRRHLPPYRDRMIYVESRVDLESATYRIRDEGPGFDTSALSKPLDPEDMTRIGGRGLLLIRAFMDEVVHNPAGNEIVLKKAAPRPPARG